MKPYTSGFMFLENPEEEHSSKIDSEAHQNLIGFFALLMEISRRNDVMQNKAQSPIRK